MADEDKRSELENENAPSDPVSAETSDDSLEHASASDTAAASEPDSDGTADSPDSDEAADAAPTAETVDSATESDAIVSEAPPSAAVADDHGAAYGGGHGGHGDDHFAHVLPMSLLVGVLLALILLTVLTVGVTAIDLGSQGNFVVAMIIASVKAALVMGYFMHMVWDNKYNVVAFTSSFLFVLLFLAMSVLDGTEYADDIDSFEADKKVEALQ